MRFLFASDSFKGSLSSRRTAELLTQAAGEIFPGCECICVEMADGGEGTTDAVLSAAGGHIRTVDVHGPLGEMVRASYGILPDGTAIMEMASASGLTLVPSEFRNPLRTTSYGTGEMIADALRQGCRKIAVAIGGSATNDGGTGCMQALGIRFLDENGRELPGHCLSSDTETGLYTGADLANIRNIDTSGMNPLIRTADFTVMCDVTNPLCGENGATNTFGEQKGGTPEMLEELEAGMENYRNIILEQFGTDMNNVPGSGAAGGLGAALMIFLNAALRSGIETVLDLTGFDLKLTGTDLVITGEGRADDQSVCGKVMQGTGMRCKKYGVPAVAVTGAMGQGAEALFDFGINSIITAVNEIMSLEEAMEQADALYLSAARRMFRLLRTGMDLGRQHPDAEPLDNKK